MIRGKAADNASWIETIVEQLRGGSRGRWRRRKPRGGREERLSEAWVEESLTWSPKRSSLSYPPRVSLAASCDIAFM